MNVAHELSLSMGTDGEESEHISRPSADFSVPKGWKKLHEAAVTLDVSKVPEYASEVLWEFFGAQSKMDEALSQKARESARSMSRNRSHLSARQEALVQEGAKKGRAASRNPEHRRAARRRGRMAVPNRVKVPMNGTPYDFDELECLSTTYRSINT